MTMVYRSDGRGNLLASPHPRNERKEDAKKAAGTMPRRLLIMIAGSLLTKQTCLLTYDFFPLVHSRELLGLAVYTGKSLLLYCYSVIYLLNNNLSSLAVNYNNCYACSNCDSLLVRSSYLVSDHLTKDVRNNYLLASCTLNGNNTLACDYGYVLSCDCLVSCCVALTKSYNQCLSSVVCEAELAV